MLSMFILNTWYNAPKHWGRQITHVPVAFTTYSISF